MRRSVPRTPRVDARGEDSSDDLARTSRLSQYATRIDYIEAVQNVTRTSAQGAIVLLLIGLLSGRRTLV